jgi:flagellar basal body rod protein FlgG
LHHVSITTSHHSGRRVADRYGRVARATLFQHGIFLPSLAALFAGLKAGQPPKPFKINTFSQWHKRCFALTCMNVSLYQAAAALNANSRWQEVIAENLASGSVPGYRKQGLSQAAVQAGLMPATELTTPNSPQYFSIPKANTTTSFQTGDMQYTGNNNDVGIEGKSFFEVQMPNGVKVLTRDGEFQVTAKGKLVTKEGYSVMNQEGLPIQLDPNNHDPLAISEAANLSQGADPKGKLKLTDVDHPEMLTQISGAYFLANNPKLHELAGTGSLRQGYLETSNTSVVGEMANMMTAMRGFEANQHVIQIQDDRLGKVISDLGNPT